MSIHNFLFRSIKFSNLTNNIFKKNKYIYNSSNIQSVRCYCNIVAQLEQNINKRITLNDDIQDVFKISKKFEDKLLYNSVIELKKIKLGYKRNRALEQKLIRERQELEMKMRQIEPIALSLKYVVDKVEKNDAEIKPEIQKTEIDTITNFPFETHDTVTKNDLENEHLKNNDEKSIKEEVLERHAIYEDIKNKNWMNDYEYYDDEEDETGEEKWHLNYGTPDPTSAVSNVPCGGCGALLHCKDTSIPGYIPSEIFQNSCNKKILKTLFCQRCHFLKFYNMALQVRVSPKDYPQILMKIKENPKALVILMVDILDFPCSVWPNIVDVIGRRRPVFLVGNKIDMLPQDSHGYLQRIEKILSKNVQNCGLEKIINVSLISAKTGYGVEELITKLHCTWKYKGDVYLVGCTNVGKSTLFNTLLQSDFCKSQASDLVQKATTSIWPGTTLNLLKFPILKPSGWRLFVRNKRLQSLNKITSQENRLRKIQLKKTNNSKYAMLIGHIEKTFSSEEPVAETKDMFSVQGNSNASGTVKIGIDENDPIYKLSKWCYDTPGVVHPAQILHLLTTEELMLTLPKVLIQPKTFSLKPGSTIFLAGLGRLDYVEGPTSMRFTIFTSESLPVTICNTESADEIYKEFVGTELFQVPMGNEERLSKWPALEADKLIHLKGKDWEESCADIILSSAGWISVSCGHNRDFVLKAWTPEKRGIYVRDSILPRAVTLRGRRIRFSPAYARSKFFIPQ